MSKNQLHNLTPKQAWEMHEADPRAVLVDIRSTMEYLFVGHPVGSVHVAWIDEPDWDINPHFVTEIRKLMLGGKVCTIDEGCAPIILICRSGKRSVEAGKALIKAGFRRTGEYRRSTIGSRKGGWDWEYTK